RECIISDDIHSKSFQISNHALTNFTCADDTSRFSNQRNTVQTCDVKIEFCGSCIRQMCLSVYSHQQCKTMFRYRFGGVTGYSQNRQTAFFCSIQIYTVETCATQQQN